MIRRLKSYTERLAHIQFYTQVEDIIKVGIARYKDKYFSGGELWIVRLYYTKNIPEEM